MVTHRNRIKTEIVNEATHCQN